ncbi:MAG: hypothetical protein JRI25_15820 [Deltaproteobacteria bacterium]|nr:hypothetical protein [Deltaproteobacteria bacterium]MBW2256051.1 hypothetical protein [Deltaproteobacteria bacterium]
MADVRRPNAIVERNLSAAFRGAAFALSLALLSGCTNCVRPLYVMVTDEMGDPAYPNRVTWAEVDDADEINCDEVADLNAFERIGDRWWCGPGRMAFNRSGTYTIRTYVLQDVYVDIANVPGDGCQEQGEVVVVVPGGTFP